MYVYEFVKVELKSRLMKLAPQEDYHVIIESYADYGWRFKQIFAPAISGYGSAPYFELIFEKEL